jgi:PAS domain S-box-containing protein
MKKLVFEAFAGKQPFRDFVSRNVRKDGLTVWLSTSGAPMLDDQGTLLGYRGAARDVTEHRLMEQWYATLVKRASDGFWINDATGRFIDVNDAYCRMIGYSREELLSMFIQNVEALEKPEETAARIKKIMKEGHDHFETRHRRKDGTAIDVEVSVNYYPVAGGQLVSFIRDITARKKDEKAVRESQQKFEALFRGNPEAAVYVAVDYRVLDVNSRFCHLFGYAAQEIIGRSLNDLIVPDNLMEEAHCLDKDAKDGYASRDTVRKRKDGSLVHVSVSAAPVIFENKLLGYIGIYKDITELKRAHEESEEARRHFQTLFNVMADPVVILDETGKILEITQRAEELAGYKREELLGKVFLETPIATAKTKEVMMKNLARRMMGMQVSPYEVEILTKDGRKLTFELNAAKIKYKNTPADLVVFRDVTERKKLEEKLRVVGSLTRHDVRNKLSAVTGNAYLLKRKLAEDPEALRQLARIEAAVREVELILEFARTYEKLGIEQLSSVDVGEAFKQAVSLFSDLKGVKVVNECEGLTVLADSLLRQLFYNLIDNSLKYGEKTTQIRVYYRTPNADQLQLVYEDDGAGIPDSIRSNLFKEGFTSGKGTGYGLFMIKRICEVYGWTIRETGKQGKGAQFTITAPKTYKTGTAYSTSKAS